MLKTLIFSLLFLFSESLLANSVQVYAHRGGRALWPENTLTAFYNALNLQVDFVDMDINLSKDLVYMVTHDNTLNKDITRSPTTAWIKESLPIASLRASEIKQYNVGKIKKGTRYAREFHKQKPLNAERIPSLSEAISFVKRHQHKETGFQLEIKTLEDKREFSVTQYAKTLYKILKKEHLIKKTEIQSFDFNVLEALHQIDPKLKLAFLTEAANPHHNRKRFPKLSQLLNYIKQSGGTFWEPEFTQLSKSSVSAAHKHGLKVVVWGFSSHPKLEKKEIKKAIQYGVDGIITDNPTLQPWIKSITAV